MAAPCLWREPSALTLITLCAESAAALPRRLVFRSLPTHAHTHTARAFSVAHGATQRDIGFRRDCTRVADG